MAITRGGGVGRDFQHRGDFGERQLTPHFERDDLAVDFRETRHGFLHQLVLLAIFHPGIEPFHRHFPGHQRLPTRPAVVAAGEVNGATSDGGENQPGSRWGAVGLTAPTLDHGFLHEVLRVVLEPGLLPGKQQKLRSVSVKPLLPV